MAVYKCKMCGGELHVQEGLKIVECEYCGTMQTISSSNDEKILRLYSRGNLLRTQNEFDKAYNIFEQIIVENPNDAEGYWNLLLCKYGITYVDDYDGSKKPNINRMSMTSIKDDQDYLKVLENADIVSKTIYETQISEIVKIQENIFNIIKNEKPYDIFISYKETDEYGDRTEDSVLAQEIYDTLTKEGYKVFLSRITLSNAIGSEYEPYIYSALYSSKLMLLVTTSEEYVNAVWVKNEWSRFLKMMKEDSSKKLIPCFKYIDPYDLPKEIRNIQSVNFDKLGALQDLVIGVNKILNKKSVALSVDKNKYEGSPFASLYLRLEELISSGKFSDASKVLEQLILFEPNNGILYLYKLMINYKITNLEDLILEYNRYINTNLYDDLFKYDNEENEVVKRFLFDVKKCIFNNVRKNISNKNFDQALIDLEYVKGQKEHQNLLANCKSEMLEEINELISNSKFVDANTVLNQLISVEPDNGELYLYKLMIEHKIVLLDDLVSSYDKYISSDLYNDLLNYENDENKIVKKFILDVKEFIYNKVQQNIANQPYENTLKDLRYIRNYKDSSKLIDELEKLVYEEAEKLITQELYEYAIGKLNDITEFPGASELILECKKLIDLKSIYDDALVKIEKLINENVFKEDLILVEIDRLKKINYKDSSDLAECYQKQLEEKIEIRRKNQENALIAQKKKNKLITTIILAAFAVIGIFCAINWWNTHVINPLSKYEEALQLAEQKQYDKALDKLDELEDYLSIKDINNLSNDCHKQIIFIEAAKCLEEGNYDLAINKMTSINGEVKIIYETNGGITELNSEAINEYKKIDNISLKDEHIFNQWYVSNYSFDFEKYSSTIELAAEYIKIDEDFNIKRTINGIEYDIRYNSASVLALHLDANELTIPSEILLDELEYSVPVTSISDNVFRDCINLTNITIPETVTSIGNSAFYNCRSLSSIIIPEGVTSIGNSAFSGCSGLTSIIIPDGVTSIGKSAFRGCSGLETMTLPFVGGSATSTTSSESTLFGYIFGTGSYAGGAKTTQFYSASDYNNYYIPTKLKNVTITGGNILYGSFYNCSGLTSITLSETVTNIGDYAFSGCSGLTSITLPETVTSIGESAFNGDDLKIYCESTSEPDTWNSNWHETNVQVYWGINENNYIDLDGMEYIIIDGKAMVSGYKGNIKEIAIPSTIEIKGTMYSVTSIAERAFYSISNLTSITLPETVTSIGKYAFGECSGLTSITIPETVTTIGYSAFSGCSGLETMILPFVGGSATSTTSSESTLFGYIFGTGSYVGGTETKQYYASSSSVCYYIPTKLKDVTITGGNILYGSFYNCSGLANIIIPETVTSIGEYAFSGCSGLTNVTIPKTVTSIGNSAFNGCSGLETMILPFVGGSATSTTSSRSTLFGYIFGTGSYVGGTETRQYYASSSSVCYYIPTKLKDVTITGGNILYGSFYNCSGLTSIILPETVTNIGDFAFRYSSGLTSITIPETVTSIGKYAFCVTGLSSIIIPKGVTSIGEHAFSAHNLKIYCESTSEPDTWNSNWHETNVQVYWGINENNYIDLDGMEYIIIDGKAMVSGYKGNIKEIAIPSTIEIKGTMYSVTSIGERAFYSISNLTSITLPETVTSIGKSAFYNCRRLSSIIIPEGVTSIGNSAFSGCSGLTSIIIPEGVTSIGISAFSECTSLTSIEIPESVTSIGGSAFEKCSSLTSIEIPEGVTSIESYTFNGCSVLTSIIIPEGVTSIENSAFSECTSLTSVIFEEESQLTSIGSYAFSSCSSLTSITIPKTVTSIGEYVFKSSSLKSVIFEQGSKLGKIGKYVFSGCHDLDNITIPETVTYIEEYAFEHIIVIWNVYFLGTPNQWSNIYIEYDGNNGLFSGNRYYYSETKPTSVGNYWYYDEYKNIKVWK